MTILYVVPKADAVSDYGGSGSSHSEPPGFSCRLASLLLCLAFPGGCFLWVQYMTDCASALGSISSYVSFDRLSEPMYLHLQGVVQWK